MHVIEVDTLLMHLARDRNKLSLMYTFGTVKIMVPFWVPIILRGLIRGLI